MDKADEQIRIVGYFCKNRVEPQNLSLNGAPVGRDRLEFRLGDFCRQAYMKNISNHTALHVLGNPFQELRFFAEPYAIAESGTFLFAPPDSGKTYTGLSLAVSIDAGVGDIFDTTQAKVLFINLERGVGGISKRLGQINDCLGLDPSRGLLMINARGRTLNDIMDVVLHSIDEHNVDIVFIDSISRAGQGGLGEDSAMNRLMDNVNQFPAWFCLAHTPRADDSHIFGSVMQDAAADVMVKSDIMRLSPDKTDVKWTVTKANDIRRPPPLYIGMEFNDFGLQRLWKANQMEFPDLESASKKASISESIRNYLSEVGNASVGDIAQEIGLNRSNVSTELNNNPSFVVVRRDGRKVFYGLATNRQESGF